MNRIALLDNVEHHDLRLVTQASATSSDNVNMALIVPTEFADVQREYPILFRQTEAGGFQAFALLGLDTDENLFLDAHERTGMPSYWPTVAISPRLNLCCAPCTPAWRPATSCSPPSPMLSSSRRSTSRSRSRRHQLRPARLLLDQPGRTGAT